MVSGPRAAIWSVEEGAKSIVPLRLQRVIFLEHEEMKNHERYKIERWFHLFSINGIRITDNFGAVTSLPLFHHHHFLALVGRC